MYLCVMKIDFTVKHLYMFYPIKNYMKLMTINDPY